MRDKCIELRKSGHCLSEIGEMLNIPERRVQRYVKGVPFALEQQRKKSVERRSVLIQNKFEKKMLSIDEHELRLSLKKHGIYGSRHRMKISDNFIRFCISRWKISKEEIAWFPRKSGVIRPSFCSLCKKDYPQSQKRRTKFCHSCYGKIHRLLSKIRAIRYKGGHCVECGLKAEAGNYPVFDFHHSNGEKDESISFLLTSKWSLLKKELDKCVLMCSNCHRTVHPGFYGDTRVLSIVENILARRGKCREGVDEHEGLTDGVGWGDNVMEDGSLRIT